jgi:short-subunit dehydrogenase
MVNSVGPINFCKVVAPIFEKNKSGHFLFINSIAGLPMPENKDYGVYAASKWALTGFAEALKSKYSQTPIKITSIHPGPIDSKMPDNAGDDWGNSKEWMMTTTEVANSVIYALSAPGTIQVGTMEFKKTNWNQ